MCLFLHSQEVPGDECEKLGVVCAERQAPMSLRIAYCRVLQTILSRGYPKKGWYIPGVSNPCRSGELKSGSKPANPKPSTLVERETLRG